MKLFSRFFIELKYRISKWRNKFVKSEPGYASEKIARWATIISVPVTIFFAVWAVCLTIKYGENKDAIVRLDRQTMLLKEQLKILNTQLRNVYHRDSIEAKYNLFKLRRTFDNFEEVREFSSPRFRDELTNKKRLEVLFKVKEILEEGFDNPIL